jgi:protein SCO1/2
MMEAADAENCPGSMRRPATMACFKIAATLALLFTPLPSLASAEDAPAKHLFELTSTGGKQVTEQSYPGKWLVLYFGFSHCPDVCPAAMQTLHAALERLGSDAQNVQPIFVTVDPARDTREALAAYVANFGPHLVGLTGSELQISAAAKSFGVTFEERETGNDNYQMTHSSYLFVVSPQGAIVEAMPSRVSAQGLANEMRKLVARDPAATSFLDAGGRRHSLSEWRGKVVLLNLWATWCAPCLKELPQLDELQRQFRGPHFEVVALSLDHQTPAVVQAALEKMAIRNLPTWVDPSGDAAEELGAKSLPATLLIDSAGREINRWSGAVDWSNRANRSILTETIGENTSTSRPTN